MRFALACFLVLISICPISKAAFVVDDSHLLSEKVTNGLNQLLSGSSEKRNIHVKVMLLSDKNAHDITSLAKQKVSEWEAVLPKSPQRKSAYLFVNLALKEGIIVLGDNFPKKLALNQSIERIQTKIVINALEKGYVENAILEAAVALTTVLDDWPQTQQPNKTIWHHLTMPLLISIGLFLCYLGWVFTRRRPPQDSPISTKAMSGHLA